MIRCNNKSKKRIGGVQNMHLRNWVKWEYIIAFFSICIVYIHWDFSIVLFLLLLLVPDISMIGYLLNTRMGAIIYNIGHHIGLASILLTISIVFNLTIPIQIAMIWLAHIFMDRAFGFGLKYANDFKETHIQKII